MRRTQASVVMALAVLARVASAGEAALGGIPKDIVVASGKVVPDVAGAADARDGFKLEIDLAIASGWHINAHELDDEFLIPTEVALTPPEGLTLSEPVYPEPKLMTFSFAPDQKLKVYEGSVSVLADGRMQKTPAAGAEIAGKVRYQACNDRQCLPPRNAAFKVMVEAGSPAATPPAKGSSGEPRGSSPASPQSGAAGGALDGKGLPSLLLAAFAGGLLLSLTPCVYPMIPVTIGYFGNQGQGSIRRSFGLASFYVLGMALTYSVLGVLAARTGAMFGQWLQSPWVLGGIAALMVALALSSFGLYELRVPSFLTSAAGARSGLFGALSMGLLMGVVAAPCIGPFVVGLLTYVGKMGDVRLGFLLFFVLALGLGTPFLLLAAFSGSIATLPRSGAWMVGVRRIFGLVLLGMAIYFVGPLLPAPVFGLLWRLYALGAVIYLLGFEPLGQAPGWLGLGFKTAFAASVALVFWFSGALSSGPRAGIPFRPFSADLLREARSTDRPVLVDFTADWCVPCRELEHRTFVDATVRAKAERFLTLRADLTRSTPPDVQALMDRHDVVGPPTVLFLAPDGAEWRDLRVEGYVSARTFAAHLDAALSRLSAKAER